MTRPTSLEALRPVFGADRRQLRRADARRERAGIRETRLRSSTARGGETLSALLARTGSAWKPRLAAVANGIDAGALLRAGRLVKVAVPQPYAQRAEPAQRRIFRSTSRSTPGAIADIGSTLHVRLGDRARTREVDRLDGLRIAAARRGRPARGCGPGRC